VLSHVGTLRGHSSRPGDGATDDSGSQFSRVLGHGFYGSALALSAQWQDSRESLEVALEIAWVNHAAPFIEADFTAMLAEVHLGFGDSLRARTLAEEAIQVALRVEIRVAQVHGQLVLARVLLAQEGATDKKGIEITLERVAAPVQSTGARSYEPQIYVERARLATLSGDDEPAQHNLRKAHWLFTQMGAAGRARRLMPHLTT
jgi:hypothetical protein